MRTSIIVVISLLFLSFNSFKPSYQLYKIDGTKTNYDEMLTKLKEADVIFFGELHNNPIAHWMELELTIDFHKEYKENLMLGAEMFESDNQLIVNEFLSGTIKDKNFTDEAKLWDNYRTDYKPLLDFAKENKLKFVASNIPRRYAALVHAQGFEGIEKLSNEAKKYIAPTPIEYDPEVECYKKMMQMMGGMGGHKPNPNLPKAQAAKDATMAWFIKENLKEGYKMIHFNGAYHSDNHQGIIWYLKKYSPDLKISTISTVEQENVEAFKEENNNLADFIIAVPETMTKTY